MASHGKQSETSSNGESGWKNRIVSYGVKNADQFAPHPKNARLHPEMQRQAMEASLDTLGWIAPVIESKSGYLIDGHERVWQALKNNAPVPFVIVDLNEDEENQALLTYDYIGQMAVYDQQQTETLLQAVNSDNAAIQAMLSNLAQDVGIVPIDSGDPLDGMIPDGERYKEQYGCIVICDSEAHQQEVYNALVAKGYSVRVVVT